MIKVWFTHGFAFQCDLNMLLIIVDVNFVPNGSVVVVREVNVHIGIFHYYSYC